MSLYREGLDDRFSKAIEIGRKRVPDQDASAKKRWGTILAVIGGGFAALFVIGWFQRPQRERL